MKLIESRFNDAKLAVEAGDGITATELLKGVWENSKEALRASFLVHAIIHMEKSSFSLMVKGLGYKKNQL
jgi:hypothetical protein